MAKTMTPGELLRQLLRDAIPASDKPWHDPLGLTSMAAAAAQLAGYSWAANVHITDGMTMRIELPTGEISWHRDVGETKLTPAPENADRIRAYLAEPERTSP
jgi:hypothetical protein